MPKRKGELKQMPLWMPVLMLAAAVALVVALSTMLRHNEVSRESASDRVSRSALLPEDWQTFAADVWSVGHPSDWKATSAPTEEMFTGHTVSAVMFAPGYARGAERSEYFSIGQINGLSIAEIEEALPEGYATEKSEFLFAGYPAVKYTKEDGSVVHYVEYVKTVFAITTEHFDDPEVGIMLATFQFNVKE